MKVKKITTLGLGLSALLAVGNLVRAVHIGIWAAFWPVLALTVFLLLWTLGAWASANPVYWGALVAGTLVPHCCSSYGMEYVGNWTYLLWAGVSLVCFGAEAWDWIRTRRRRGWWNGFLALALAVGSVCGGIWGFQVLQVRVRQGPAQNEVWAVPACYDSQDPAEPGTLELLTYETKAYATDGRAVTKEAWVYLPYGYDPQGQYEILYLLHGTGDREDYWLVRHGQNKTMLDNLIQRGDICPVIVVTPTWYVEEDCLDDPDLLTYGFAQELRHDLIPAVESQYATYAQDVTEEGLQASRQHRSLAGLSRGAATVYRAGMAGCFDYFSKFGTFSGRITEPEALEVMSQGDWAGLELDYLYHTSGTFDFYLEEHWQSSRLLLNREDRLIDGVNTDFDLFPMDYHSMHSWHIALYNCLQKFYS